MTQAQPIDSEKTYAILEKLRKHLKLRVEDIVHVLEISRPAYYGWKKGKRMNNVSGEKALKTIRILLAIAKNPEWRERNDLHLTIWKRREILDGLLTDEKVSD